jgi:CRISPR-associated protein Cpf1
LIWLIDAIMQIRNTSEKEVGQEWKKVKITNDFILSPVEPHFDSRERYVKTKKIVDGQEIFETENKEPFPTSWDANGAFNIARKGLMMLKRIAENPEKPNLFISDEEWDEFANN